MSDLSASVPFALGTFSVAGSPAFPGLVMGERMVALRALVPVCEQIGVNLRKTDSLLTVLEDWPSNVEALRQATAHLAGAPFATLSVPLSWVRVHAPLEQPRQIF